MGQKHTKSPPSLFPLFIAGPNKDGDFFERVNIPDDFLTAKHLINLGADVNEERECTRWEGHFLVTPLRYAVRNDLPRITDLLIEKGARITDKVLTSLWFEPYDILKTFIKRGYYLNQLTFGTSPLIMAILYQQYDVVVMLINRGVDMTPGVNKYDNVTTEPIKYAFDVLEGLVEMPVLYIEDGGRSGLSPDRRVRHDVDRLKMIDIIAAIIVANPEGVPPVIIEKVRQSNKIQSAIRTRIAEVGRSQRSNATLLWQNRRNAMRRRPIPGGNRTSKKKNSTRPMRTRRRRMYRFK